MTLINRSLKIIQNGEEFVLTGLEAYPRKGELYLDDRAFVVEAPRNLPKKFKLVRKFNEVG